MYIDSVEDKASSKYDLYALAQETPAPPEVLKFTIMVVPYLVINTLYLVCVIYAWE